MLIVSGCRTCHTLPKNILYEQYSYKNISLGYVYIEKGKLTINTEEPLCSKCNYGDAEFVDDNVYIESHKLQCK